MHENDGELAINGKGLTPSQLSMLAGCPDVDLLISELEAAGVFSRRDDGTIYSRRMIKDAQKAAQDKANGKKGGNPRITKADNAGVNPSDKGEDKAQKPEARSQIPEKTPPSPPRGGAGELFDQLVSSFPASPHTKRDKAERWFNRQPEPTQRDALAAAKRYADWWKAEQARRGRSLEEAAAYVPPLDGWLADGAWKSVAELPAAQAVEPMVKLDRERDEALWLACERVMGKRAPTSGMEWAFRQSVVDEARRLQAA